MLKTLCGSSTVNPTTVVCVADAKLAKAWWTAVHVTDIPGTRYSYISLLICNTSSTAAVEIIRA